MVNLSTRTVGANVLAVLCALSVVATTSTFWAERWVLDSDRFSESAADVIQEPAVADAIAAVASDQLVDVVLAVADVRRSLPGPFRDIGSGLEQLIRSFLSDQMASVVRTDTVQRVLVRAVRTAHAETVSLVRDGVSASGSLTMDGKLVRLDLTGVLAGGLDALVERRLLPSGLGGLQEALRDGLDSFRVWLDDLTGVDLGPELGTVVVYDNSSVDEGGLALRSARWMSGSPGGSIGLWIVAAILTGLASMVVSPRRMLTLSWFGAILAVVAVLANAYWRRVAADIENLVSDPQLRLAAVSLLDQLWQPLWTITIATIAVGLILLIVGRIGARSSATALMSRPS